VGVCDALDVGVKARRVKVALEVLGELRVFCSGMVLVLGEVMYYSLLVDDVVVAGIRLLGSGRVGMLVGRLVLCFAVGLCCWGRG
jgi:hypothetical protein